MIAALDSQLNYNITHSWDWACAHLVSHKLRRPGSAPPWKNRFDVKHPFPVTKMKTPVFDPSCANHHPFTCTRTRTEVIPGTPSSSWAMPGTIWGCQQNVWSTISELQASVFTTRPRTGDVSFEHMGSTTFAHQVSIHAEHCHFDVPRHLQEVQGLRPPMQ